MGIVFPEPETSFAAGLAAWIEPRAKPAPETEPTAPQPSAFEAECAKLEGSKEFQKLAAKLRAGLKGKFATGSASDVKTAYAVFFELLVQWKLLTAEAQGLADELASSSTELPELRCTLLLSLYAMAQQYGAQMELRFALLLRLIQYCTATNSLGKVLGDVDGRVERVERWVREWELSEAQQKEIWGLVFDAHADDSRVMYDCALKYFGLHEGAELAKLPALRERMVQGLLMTIRSPELYRCDELSQLKVIQQLANDKELAHLHRLLQIMARET